MPYHFMRLKVIALAASCCLLLVEGCRKRPVQGESVRSGAGADAEPLSVRFHEEGHAFAHVLQPVKAPRGVDSARASDCGRCHTEFYREWRDSTHAHALRDIQYQAELFKPDTPRWLCLNCHIPLQNQRREIVVGLEDGNVLKPVVVENAEYDGEMRDEAITCATCHVRVDDRGESYVIGPLGNTDPLHPVREDRAFLRRICLRCHDPRSEEITETFVCSFTTKKELDDGPYSDKKRMRAPGTGSPPAIPSVSSSRWPMSQTGAERDWLSCPNDWARLGDGIHAQRKRETTDSNLGKSVTSAAPLRCLRKKRD